MQVHFYGRELAPHRGRVSNSGPRPYAGRAGVGAAVGHVMRPVRSRRGQAGPSFPPATRRN
jgi:hypothetical protein